GRAAEPRAAGRGASRNDDRPCRRLPAAHGLDARAVGTAGGIRHLYRAAGGRRPGLVADRQAGRGMTDVIVVGSGPGGTNAAARLVEAGCRVLMLDYGN